MYYVLFYEVIDDYVQQRAQYREEHLNLADESALRGELILGGAYDEPADGALLVFNCNDTSVIEKFVKDDPYVINGLVTKWYIRKWTVVVGSAKR